MTGRLALSLLFSALLTSCGASIKGRWDGSGEIFDGKFFNFSVNFKDEKSGVINLTYAGQPSKDYALCSMRYKDMTIEFVIEGSGLSSDCKSLKEPLTFYGTQGAGLIAGEVRNVQNQRIGVWRAFEVEK